MVIMKLVLIKIYNLQIHQRNLFKELMGVGGIDWLMGTIVPPSTHHRMGGHSCCVHSNNDRTAQILNRSISVHFPWKLCQRVTFVSSTAGRNMLPEFNTIPFESIRATFRGLRHHDDYIWICGTEGTYILLSVEPSHFITEMYALKWHCT